MAAMVEKVDSEYLRSCLLEMERDLECPVCLIPIRSPPIYVCENQHGLCSTCRTKIINQVSFNSSKALYFYEVLFVWLLCVNLFQLKDVIIADIRKIIAYLCPAFFDERGGGNGQNLLFE